MALAKITRPTSVATLTRPRLFRLLDNAKKKPVTWVWAPPGAGKTALIASYFSARKSQTLWYQVDEGDEDLATFFYYLGQAAPKRKRPLPLFTPEYQQGSKIFTRNFFRDLYGRMKPPFALVFDNYQEVSTEAPLHEAMRAALAEMPIEGRMIFISRSEPPAQFADLRAKQAMELVDWSELRFSGTEVNGLVKRLAPGKWSKAAIDKLHDASDGWVAGLILLLEQLASDEDHKTTEQMSGKASQVLFDYFAAEVFKKTTADSREVLLETSFLPTVTASAAEMLTGNSRAGSILAQLHRENFFTNKRQGADPSYEYHPLFREFLLAEGSRVFSDERQNEIRRRAGEIAKTAGRFEVAAELYRDAEDWEDLTRLICENTQALMGQGRTKVVQEWISFIPTEFLEKIPWLVYWKGLSSGGWKYEESRCDLEKAFEQFRLGHNVAGMLVCSASLIISCAGAGDSTAMDPWIRSIESLMPQVKNPLPEDIETLVALAMNLAITARTPQHPDGDYWVERAVRLTRRESSLAFFGIAAQNWLQYYTETGNLTKAAAIVDDVRSVAAMQGCSPVIFVNASMAVSWYEWLYAVPSYRHTVSRVLEVAVASGMFYVGKHLTLANGLFGAFSDGDAESAEAWIREIAKDVHLFGPGLNCYYQLALVRRALLDEDIEGAAAHQPEMLRLGIIAGWPLMEAVVRLISALVLHKRHEEATAREQIGCALEIGRTMKSPYVEFMARKTEADIYFDNGEEAKAFESLRIAMELGRKGGFVNSQVWMPKVMARLCAKALEAGIEVDYVRMLVRKRNLVPEEPPVEIEGWPWPVKIYTLGQFQVLKDDQPLSFSHKVQRKPLALLKAVIALGGKGVREDVLTDSLWPDADGDAARFALTSAIHRLRKLLGQEQAIIRKDNEISLDDRYCWVDTWALERLLTRSETASNGNEDSWQQASGLIQRALTLYKGPFLGGDPEAPWGMSLADRLRRRLLRQLKLIGERYEHKEQLQQAADLYEQALRVDRCAEDVCRRLMGLYYQLGRPTEVAAIYRQCREALNSQFGINLSAETEELLKKLRLNGLSQSTVGR
jgi:DNA-binding SARP family transcriptional activator